MAQFEGGYLRSEGTDFSADRGQAHAPRAQESNTIRSITISQLNQAISSGDSSIEVLKIDGVDASHLMLCGKILTIERQVSSTVYTINDGTGDSTVKFFTSKNDDLSQTQSDEDMLTEGLWCMVYGNYRSMGQDYFINAFRIRPITDHNEISFHYASCIRQHLYFTKGPLPENPASKTTGNVQGAPPQQSFQATTQFQQQGPRMNAQVDVFSRIEDTLRHCNAATGMHFDKICQTLQAEFSPSSLKVALNTLVTEGRACMTVSDDHYRWSS